ncbi:MAG TPA: serine/threonine-protein kinase [Isosphaeraceae bacterium]|nr:serine/threonine-protein kinase [Isosphaeraceae bacterium]
MIGEKLGSFRIEAVLGTGAMGVVYRGVNEAKGRTAAIKVINGEIAQRGHLFDRFRREAEILQQFRHPNIVRFLAIGRSQGTSYFAMEYVQGQTLERLLATRGPLPWREVVDLGIEICDALHYAHEHGVVHRDLKPSNLMISEQGQVKLTDFGIAKDLDATALTATGLTLGTAAYMAPEQIRGTPAVSHKTDLYALGVVLYRMLTGQPAFVGATAVILMHMHQNDPAPRPSAKVAEIPVALDDLIVTLLAKAPADRPWDAAAVGLALAELRDKADRGEPIAMAWPPDGDAASQPARSGPPVATGAKQSALPTRRFDLSRSSIEIALLVLGLVLLCLSFGYMLWPPGAGYLYHHAERLMASKRRHDWIEARDSYIEPLDRRFPDNRYRQTTQAWRDRIILDEAQGRARMLDSPVQTGLSEPKTKGEHLYVAIGTLARGASGRGDDLGAIRHWEELAQQLEGHEPEERPWFLLARTRADELKRAIARRREVVNGVLELAADALRNGRTEEARTIRDEILTRYGKYTDLSELLELAGLAPRPAVPPSPAPQPEPMPPQGSPEPGRPTP